MAVPGFQTFFLPTLRVLADGGERRARDARDAVADVLALTDEERQEAVPTGQAKYDNRAAWAQTYLYQAGLVTRPRRGVLTITPEGRRLLDSGVEALTIADLEAYDSFREFKERRRTSTTRMSGDADSDSGDATLSSPEERIAEAVSEQQASLAGELRTRFRDLSPRAFEILIVRLLSKMGYGTTETSDHTGGSGDEGIDGIIRKDALGLDRVYMQAKRYVDNSVGPEAINAFYGALQRKGADRGVFITSSSFTAGARRAEQDFRTIVLVDGERLAELMIEHEVGVQVDHTVVLKKVDEDFFEDL